MRKTKSDMKTVTKSMKMKPEDAKTLEEAAKASDMSFSAYVTTRALHADISVTPEVMCRLEDIVNRCVRMAGSECSEKEEIRKEVDQLWELLK